MTSVPVMLSSRTTIRRQFIITGIYILHKVADDDFHPSLSLGGITEMLITS